MTLLEHECLCSRNVTKKDNMVFEYIDKNKARLIELTKKLVAIPTVNPPGVNYERMVCLLEAYCKKLGLKTKRIVTPVSVLKEHGVKGGSKRINLIANWDVNAHKTLHINSHYDVVPATSSWRTNPFAATIKGNRIYGRGTEDMKANIAVALTAIEALKKNNVAPLCNIELSFTPDEETGGRTGFGYIVKRNIVKPDYAISEGYNNRFISYGNKGLVWFKIDIKGKACHSSEPDKGINAFEKMVDIANSLIRLNKKIIKRKTMFKVKDPQSRVSTMVLGGEISGGVKANIVPDSCTFMIDRRFLPEEGLDEVKREIANTVKKLQDKDKDLDVKVSVMGEEESVVSDESSILFKNFSQSIKRVLGVQAQCALMAGATDIRFLIRKGIPCLGYSVDGGHSAHSDREFVYIKSLVDTTKIFADIMMRLS
jgi:succinyl-diaminopimelate desuccinylase